MAHRIRLGAKQQAREIAAKMGLHDIDRRTVQKFV